jgi:hypothetical protein
VKFENLINDFLSQIDFKESAVIQPGKLLFVCGGQFKSVVGSPGSMRELLLSKTVGGGRECFLEESILLAEKAVGAFSKSEFGNLLDLEYYIAALVQAVLLFVESPGSICELGAFVKMREIREKLIVILPSEYINHPSFITNGAIKFLEHRNKAAKVLSFDWTNNSGEVKAPAYAINEMLVQLPEAIAEIRVSHAKESFDDRNIGRLMT